jgi:hypothetical protein
MVERFGDQCIIGNAEKFLVIPWNEIDFVSNAKPLAKSIAVKGNSNSTNAPIPK